MNVDILANALRNAPNRSRSVPVPVVEPTPQERPLPTKNGPMIEFSWKQGQIDQVFVRSGGKVRILEIDRDADGNIKSATLVKE